MTVLAIFFALLLALFCGAFVLLHSLRTGKITLLDWSLMASGGLYGPGWILVMLVTENGGNPMWEPYIKPYSDLYFVHTMASFLLVGGILLGWYGSSAFFKISSASGNDYDGSKYFSPYVRGFWVLLLGSIVLQWLYASAYGGYLGVLDYAASIRSSVFSEVPDNSWSFLKPFGGLAMMAAYGFFGLWLSGKKGIWIFCGMVISFVFSIYILYSWMGRMGFVVFCFTFILGWRLRHWYNPVKMIFWGVLLFVFMLLSAYVVSKLFSLKSADSFLQFLAKELAFPFGSFFVNLENGSNLWRLFVDFIMVPVYFFPSSWWMGWIETASDVNTALIMGAPKGVAGVTGAIPVDLLTLGLMQAHIFGVCIVGGMFGVLLQFIQSITDRIALNGVRAVFSAYISMKIALLGVFYSQPNLFVVEVFSLIVAGVVLFLFVKFSKIH